MFPVVSLFLIILPGFLAVPAGAVGQFLGGFIIRKFKLNVLGIIKFNLGCSVAVLLFAAAFWAKCEQTKVVGLNLDYQLIESQ